MKKSAVYDEDLHVSLLGMDSLITTLQPDTSENSILQKKTFFTFSVKDRGGISLAVL
jgi:hypothetical protein